MGTGWGVGTCQRNPPRNFRNQSRIFRKPQENVKLLRLKNTRKAGVKTVDDTLFFQIDNILKIVPRLDEYI